MKLKPFATLVLLVRSEAHIARPVSLHYVERFLTVMGSVMEAIKGAQVIVACTYWSKASSAPRHASLSLD